ncbi:hypothetical protein [Nocardia tengchongensis]|uniref:hypothetical protein n=1 Tax=Nocardia tengchongensis TaxID=2055889 RepID=UPI0036CF4AB4
MGSALRPAVEGATALFLVSRVGDDAGILSSARRAGVEHVVLVLSITVQTHPHLGPAQKNTAVEQPVETSGMCSRRHRSVRGEFLGGGLRRER